MIPSEISTNIIRPQVFERNPILPNEGTTEYRQDIGGEFAIQLQEPIPSGSSKMIESNSSLTRSGVQMSELSREEIDAKIAASEARNDTKIEKLSGKIDLVLSKLDAVRDGQRETLDSVRQDNRSVRANQWTIGIGLAVLIIAIVTLFPAIFGLGAQIKDIVDHSVESHTPASQPSKN